MIDNKYKEDFQWFDFHIDLPNEYYYYVLVTDNFHIPVEINNKYFNLSRFNSLFLTGSLLSVKLQSSKKLEPFYTDRTLLDHQSYSKYPNWTKRNKLCTVDNFIKLIEFCTHEKKT